MNQNNSPYVVVITGGIATGKSEASKYLKELGYTVLDCDKIVHDGYRKNTDLYSNLISEYTEVILDDYKQIDRQKLGKIAFEDDKKLSILNSLVHKYVVERLIEGVGKSDEKLIFLDIPLMYEQKDALQEMGLRYDEIWLIYVSRDIQKQRLAQRATAENKNIDQALSIINKQMPIEEKKTLADRVINNENSKESLKQQLSEQIERISLFY